VISGPAMGAIGSFRAAVTLLTRLPVGVPADAATSGAAAFPLAGALVGLFMAVALILVGGREPVLAALGAVGIGVIMTGALHLDGLADTADALAAPTPDRAEAARTDPSSGPAGVAAVVLAVGLEAAALASLVADAPLPAAAALVACSAVARAVPVVAAVLAGPAAATGSCFGAWFIRGIRPRDAAVASGLAVAVVVVAALVASEPQVALVAGLTALVGLLASIWLRRRRGGLDGDAFGALIVVTGTTGLAALALLT
jgi:adenosylcobinamide-GDP ribazoletransferase